MPTTGILNQEESPVENSNLQQSSGEQQSTTPPLPPSNDNLQSSEEPFDAAGVVSSTTVDPDAAMDEEDCEQQAPVESSVATLSQEESTLSDGKSHEIPKYQSEVSQPEAPVTFSQPSNTSFQSAFAAFASASTSHTEAEAMEVEDTCASAHSEAVSCIPTEEINPMVEQSVTTLIDSGLVTTTQESLVTSGETPEIQPIAMEQDSINTYTSAEATVDSALVSDASPVVEDHQEISQDSNSQIGFLSQPETLSEEGPVEAAQVTQEVSYTGQIQQEGNIAQPQQEESSTAQPQQEEINIAQPQQEEINIDQPQQEESNREQPQQEESNIAQPQQEESNVEQPQQEERNTAQPQQEESNIVQPQQESNIAQPQQEESITAQTQQEENNIVQSQQEESNIAQPQQEEGVVSDAVYFIQLADSVGEIVTSIIDPNDIAAYSDSIVYKQCMGADGQIETTIVNSGSVPATQAEQQTVEESIQAQPEMEQQVIYAHDLNGHLTPIDSAQSATDVAPPGKQFVYMQDSSGRIIRTIMDANQTMVPGQQVYYTQSEDGRIITSVMDSNGQEEIAPAMEAIQQQQQQISQLQHAMEETGQVHPRADTSAFSMDNNLSGLNMLAELSAGQTVAEHKGASSTDSNSQDSNIDEFRPVAMITRRVAEDGVEVMESNMANLKVQADLNSYAGPQESMVMKLISEIKTESAGPGDTVSRDNLFVQWQNLDAMCWMDVVLVMLVYSPTLRPLVNLDPSHELASTLLITLLKANRQAQVLLQNLLKNSVSETSLQTGAGNIGVLSDPKSSKLACKENMDEIGKAINILYAMREKIWQALQPRLRCERGKHNSPVLVLPLLVREKPVIKQMFTMTYRYVFKCEKCGYSQDDSHSKILPTIPAVPPDFNMKEPCFVRNCFECQAPDQRMFMKFEGLQDFVQMHFVKGLPHSRFDELSFDLNEDHYEVTGVVHYKNNPDHFIAWVRNAPGNTWMECDDLKSVITRYQAVTPVIPPSQVHMVMWERRLTPEHTLVMRDTEDTNYLASLVLTVQQPASSQASTTETSNRAPPASTTSMAQAGPASTFLSGLISQSQSSTTFQSYTPRRGSRGRGNRGGVKNPRGGITIRRASPMVNTQLTTPRQPSTQIIRLPMAALQGVNSNLRGSSGTSPTPRYVFVGGNNSQSAQTSSTGTASKVVVLRSQGGSGSLNNLSAAQLLQLLQRSGAISQSNAKITTQITRPASDGTPETQTLVTKLPATSTPSQPEEFVATGSTTAAITPQDQADGEVQHMSVSETQPDSVETTASALSGEMAALTPATTTSQIEPLSEQVPSSMSVLDGTTETQETETTVPSTLQSNSTVIETSSAAQEASTSSGTIRTLSMNTGEPTRYVQIPNPSGGANIMTQLVMKGGKVMLVPVDKSAQVQTTTSTPSILRLSGSAIKSSQLSTSSISSPTILQTAASPTISNISSPQIITLPAGSHSSGGKRTIQLITVPRGTGSSTGGQATAKTIIVSPAGNQSSRNVTDTESGLSSTSESVSQPGSIVIRELKRSDDSTSTVNTFSALSSSGTEAVVSSITGSNSTFSLLRDVNMQSVGKTISEEVTPGAGVSLFSASSALTSKPQESFKYILPGSSLYQMSTIQNVNSTQSGRAFTALSSSGTIIGGQLTPTSGPVSVDQSTSVETVVDGTQTIYTALKDDESLLRGRGRGRNQRVRGRGSRTRGRGRLPLSETSPRVITSQPKIIKRGGTISMLSTDLRQVGGQIIESASEDVDGVPVVSIPDFSGVGSMQTESLSAAECLNDSLSQSSSGLSESMTSPPLQSSTNVSASDPLVITQTIPSIKGNHGFDILTQGILGTGGQPTPLTPRKSGISLLTGKPVEPPSSLSPFSLEASKTQQSLAMGQSVTQNEIETLIKAAQGAAKPPKPGQTSSISSQTDTFTHTTNSSVGVLSTLSAMSHRNEGFMDMSTDNSIDKGANQNLGSAPEDGKQTGIVVDSLSKPSSFDEIKESEEERVVNVDESQVSAAERYRMPTELFQPDDESPEKPVKSDVLSRHLNESQILGEDLPSKLFQDSEISSQDEDVYSSPQFQPKSPSTLNLKTFLESPQVPLDKIHDSETTGVKSYQLSERIETDMDVEDRTDNSEHANEEIEVVKSPGKGGRQGRRKGRSGKGKGRGGRRKSSSVSDVQESPLDVSSPERIGQQLAKSEIAIDEQESSMKGSGISLTPGNEGSPLDICSSRREDVGKGSEFIKSEEVTELEKGKHDKDITEEKPMKQDHSALSFLPTVTRSRPKVDWSEEQFLQLPLVFNYQILSRKHKKINHRHPSLGPKLTSFTCPPIPLPEPVGKSDMRLPLNAMVIRNMYKALERPTVDPSKEPTVIPLVAEEDGDPACTGGSVVTSHTDGEVFTGVIVRQRREMADWSCGLEDEDEELGQMERMAEDKDEIREYAETMWTAMCMEVGDFYCFDHSDSDSGSDYEEDCIDNGSIVDDMEEPFSDNFDNTVSQKHLHETDVVGGIEYPQTTPQSPVGSKSPSGGKRSASDEPSLPISGHSPTKRPKVAIDDSISYPVMTNVDSHSSKKLDVPTTCINGISNNQSVSSPSSTPLPSTHVSDKPESFVSPARRSSRTPIPSKKLRDYVEDQPLKSTTKGRRSSALSSDDDLSGGEVSVKKGKKKSVKTFPIENLPLQ